MASFLQRWALDATHAFKDVYGNIMYGDEAGEATKLAVVVTSEPDTPPDNKYYRNHNSTKNNRQRRSFKSIRDGKLHSSLGATFCEIEGRAYVQSVEPNSRAHQMGVQPKDCVQYAAVLAKEWNDPLGSDESDIQKHALEREEAGQRITYKELKHLLQTGIREYQQQQQQQQQSGNNGDGVDAFGSILSPNNATVPTTIQVGARNNNLSGPLSSSSNSSPLSPLHPGTSTTTPASTNDPLSTRPVVLVFRRTKPWPTQSPSLPIWPNFRLDDECQVACQILNSLTTAGAHSEAQERENGKTSSNSTAAVSPSSSTKPKPPEETVEAATIRGMIQRAVGLAFLRSNKFVCGLSIHAGSGIAIARLADGTWSAPSAIGVAGMGLGLQVGVEVAHSIVVLNTQEALEHFQRGGSFTVGANVGAAVGGIGREAVGAASLSGALCGVSMNDATNFLVKDDEYHADTQDVSRPNSVGVAPLVAYAKSQGLYVGLSLEGSRIHVRDDVNARTYQFQTRKTVTTHDLLIGKVAPPPEAEPLYAALHHVEFTHELQSLPVPPKALWANKPWHASADPLSLEGEDYQEFEEKFRDFLYGGVYVWRVKRPGSGHKNGHVQVSSKERRTLWLYVPEGSASLQLGFVSKLSNVEAKQSTSNDLDDRRSIASEEVTLDSALMDNASILNNNASAGMQVELSRKHSMELTDVVCMSQTSPSDVALDDPSDLRRLVSLESVNQELVFVVKSDEEAHVLMSGLKLLLESETKRCGVRGGVGKNGKGSSRSPNKRSGKKGKSRAKLSGYGSSEIEDNDDASAMSLTDMPEGWRSWVRAPGRNYLRGKASANDQGYPQYVHGQLLVRDIAKNIHIPLPLSMCRALLLDSTTSPVIAQWEKDRGDVEFEKTSWTFPPATPREGDQFQSEKQLIASGSMCGAHRTISYQRPRNGQLVRLFETQIVDSDDSEKLAFQIHERMPRRGFSIKVKITLRAYQQECEATVLGEIRPVGKNMSNPEAVHKAFVLVLEELRDRYGADDKGLLCGFLNFVETCNKEDLAAHLGRSGPRPGEFLEEKKEADSVPVMADSKSIKLEDMLKANASLGLQDELEPKSLQDRPSKASPMDIDKYKESYRKPKLPPMPSDTFDAPSTEPVMIEVKPLPKIRLSLMPSPREEDEHNLHEDGESSKTKKESPSSKDGKKSKSKKQRTGWGKKRRSKSKSK